MTTRRSTGWPVEDLDRIVTASVATTGRILAEVAPDLTFLQWRVLVVVGARDGVAVSEIARAIGSKLPAASRLVGRLRARGLVDTTRGSDDARVTLVQLTPSGGSLRRRVIAGRRRRLRSGATHVGLDERVDRPTLARVVAVLEAADR